MRVMVFGSSESMHGNESVAAYVLNALGIDLCCGNTWESVCTLIDRNDGNMIYGCEADSKKRAMLRIQTTGETNGSRLMSLVVPFCEIDPQVFWQKLKQDMEAAARACGSRLPGGAIAVAQCADYDVIQVDVLSTKTIEAEPTQWTYSFDEGIARGGRWTKKYLDHVERAESFVLDSWDPEWCDGVE